MRNASYAVMAVAPGFVAALALSLGAALGTGCQRRDIRIPRDSGSGDALARQLNAGVELLDVRRAGELGPPRAIARVRWTNRSEQSFGGVEVRCYALGIDGALTGIGSRSFSARERGRIRPGFSGRIEVPVELADRRLKKMSCSISSAS